MTATITAPSFATPAAWPLDPAERILWQGRPSAALYVTLRQAGKLASGTFGLTLFLYLADRLQMQVAPYWDVWVIVLAVFFASIPADILRAALVRRWSIYALTDRRALIATDLPLWGRITTSIPIDASTRIDHHHGQRGSVLFPGPKRLIGTGPKPGFERIGNSDAVLALIRVIQKGAACSTSPTSA
ncbi:MAG: hypothetical protein ACT4OK_21300 [Gemmobacter sp.]